MKKSDVIMLIITVIELHSKMDQNWSYVAPSLVLRKSIEEHQWSIFPIVVVREEKQQKLWEEDHQGWPHLGFVCVHYI